MDSLISYLLAASGLTVLIVWPDRGPSAWFRERLLRRVLPTAAAAVIDCYVCTGFWSGAVLSPVWWFLGQRTWVWIGCLMIPPIFWLLLGHHRPPLHNDHSATNGDARP